MKMRILFIARSNLNEIKGGDTTQIYETANALRALGVEVDIHLNSGIVDYNKYDLIHYYNIIDPEDILGHIYQTHKPFVISTIYVNYSEYDKVVRRDFVGILSRFLPYTSIEYFKKLIKFLFKGKGVSSLRYFIKGHRKSITYILQNASILLPNSESEYKRLARDFGIQRPYKVVVNGVNHRRFIYSNDISKREGVLCVGRIEGRKNQLNLIKAIKGLNIPLYFVGRFSTNQLSYVSRCRKEAGENVHFLNEVYGEKLHAMYAKAKVHILPSWFETTGLVSLEAALMGCRIVITDKGDTRDYFGDHAIYCQPDDPDSIREAILKAYNDDIDTSVFREIILQKYTWEQAAKQTLEAYQKVLKKEQS
jgi:glycosyltransferase involved in cell wall biosynthesis